MGPEKTEPGDLFSLTGLSLRFDVSLKIHLTQLQLDRVGLDRLSRLSGQAPEKPFAAGVSRRESFLQFLLERAKLAFVRGDPGIDALKLLLELDDVSLGDPASQRRSKLFRDEHPRSAQCES